MGIVKYPKTNPKPLAELLHPAEAAEQLGHSATSMTASYSHVFPDSRQEKVARLDALLGGR